MNGAIHNEHDLNYDGPGPLGWRKYAPGPHTAIPVIHWLLDEYGHSCWQVWCVCGFLSPPFVDLDVAKISAWEHQSPDGRISDLRRYCATHYTEPADTDEDISEETVSTNGHSAQPCPHCGRRIRPSNLPRHIEARHNSVTV